MTCKPKEMYRTIKRSLSTVSSNHHLSGFGGTGGARYHGYNGGKQWVHPPDVLNHGRVEYTVKLLGRTEVLAAKGTEVIRDAVKKIRFGLQVSRGVTGNSGSKLLKVDIQINVDGVTVAETKSKKILYKYPLHRISFCADDKHDKRLVSFIAKTDTIDRHDCFVFLSDKLAEEITLTIGEAFDLAYQKFLNGDGPDLKSQKQLLLLRKRIVDLEKENEHLKRRLKSNELHDTQLELNSRHSELSNHYSGHSPPVWEQFSPSNLLPRLPTTPVPIGPPPGRKPSLVSTRKTVDDKPEQLFDDWFDPRADEKQTKDSFGLTPFAVNLESTNDESRHDLDQMLSIVDERLAEMNAGFKRGLALGDTGDNDLLKDWETTTVPEQQGCAVENDSVTNGHV